MTSLPGVRVVLAVLLGLVVFAFSGTLSQVAGGLLPESPGWKEWLTTSIFQLFMATLAILAILGINKGGLAGYGFTLPGRLSYPKLALIVLGMEVLVTLAFLPCPVEGDDHFASQFSFLQNVIGVWVIASTCEEIVSRGLIMGYLAPLRAIGIRLPGVRVSLPVLAAALFFSAMHLPLLIMGIDTCLGIRILVATFLLGVIAGYYREKSGSLVPAVLAHMLANVFGMGIEAVLERIG